ncbi:MAG TPA: toll/interleukin-1 receptor domain-containing protein [Pyrinomonadaceae bacterium]|jgi:hypothetical protein
MEQTPAVPAADYKYWAFISYSHQDEEWAKWVHESLETYRVPRRLVGRATPYGPVPERAFPIFRDRDELPGSFDLGGNLRDALRRSRTLIVICSPRAAASRWVNEEVRQFKALGRENVLCLIVEGEPNASDKPELGLPECFPPALRFRVGADGQLTDERTEPIAADARKGRDGRVNAKLKLAAGILGVGFDELRQRERVRRRRERLRTSAYVFGVVLLLVAGYLLMADRGYPVPGGEAVRTRIDRHDLSLLRRARSMTEIHAAADAMRRQLFAAVNGARTEEGWIKTSLKPTERYNVEAWTHSQALYGMLRTPNVSQPELRALLPLLDAPFEPGTAVEREGVKYGWISHQNDTDTLAEPALWTAAAQAAALARPGLLAPDERARALAHFVYTQEVLRLHRPLEDGGWNMFPRQKDAAEANPYTTTLALLMLLEAKRANLPWEGSTARRDELLRKTADWLIARYDATNERPGWHAGESAYETFDGLTLQIYALLLRAHTEAGITLPPAVMQQMPKHLAECAARDVDFPIGRAEFSQICTGADGREYTGKEGVGFLWYPWAMDAASRWLRWAEQHKAETAPEDRVRVRRALGHMVVDLGPEAVRHASADWTFIPAETLYGLSDITPVN